MVKNAHEPRTAEKGLPPRLLPLVVLVLAVIGIGVSIELSRIHYLTHTDPAYKSVCAVNEEVNCETVARSPYSIFLGAPVSAWGVFGYTLIALFAAWSLSRRRLHPGWAAGMLMGLVGASVAASSVLAYISFARIDSVCLFCMTLYGINLLLVVTMVVWATVERIRPLRAIGADIGAIVSKPALLVGLIAAVGGSCAGLALGVSPYWHHARWDDLPKLPTGIDQNGHHWIGARKPLLSIVEFSDYECPFCRRAHRDIRLMASRYPDEVRLIHRHLPLDQSCNSDINREFHKRACEFSKAAVCAADQGKFWEMNDALFSLQDTVRPEDVDLEGIAVELGLDRSQFKECLAKPGIPKQVKLDMDASRKLDVKGTPTFFVGPQRFAGGIPEVAIERAIERAQKKP